MPYGETAWDLTQDELEAYPAWSLLVAHSRPALTPLYYRFWLTFTSGFSAVDESFSIPTSHGINYKMWRGHCYVSVKYTTDNEAKEREPLFRKKMAPIIEDPFKWVNDQIAIGERVLDPLIPAKVEDLDDWELYKHLIDCRIANDQAAITYNIGWAAICSGLGFFEKVALDYAGLKHTEAQFSNMIAGIENRLYKSNSDLAVLARKSIDFNLDQILKLPDENVIHAMEQAEHGKEWLEVFYGFVDKWGMRQGRMYEFCEPSWYEKPSLLLPYIRRYVELGGIHRADTERERLVKQREKVIDSFLANIPQKDHQWVRRVITLGQVANYFSEDGAFIEFKRHALLRRVYMEYGRRWAQAGMIEEPNDILYVLPEEVRAHHSMRMKGLFKSKVEERKKERASYQNLVPGSTELPLFLGDTSKVGEMVGREPMISVLVAMPEVTAEQVGALCVGAACAPGMEEGVARVIMSEAEWDKIQLGDILVTPMTSAVWTPLFGLIKAVVCDSGGAMSHPVIVSREYGIPCVAGTLDGTRLIKTGDRIRVDGNLGRVYKVD